MPRSTPLSRRIDPFGEIVPCLATLYPAFELQQFQTPPRTIDRNANRKSSGHGEPAPTIATIAPLVAWPGSSNSPGKSSNDSNNNKYIWKHDKYLLQYEYWHFALAAEFPITATIEDVARQAQVSISTVSRVINRRKWSTKPRARASKRQSSNWLFGPTLMPKD